jgi:hypothetical protein
VLIGISNGVGPNLGVDGILVGVNLEKFIVQGIVLSNFFLKFKLKNKADNFEWTLIAVYGAAQEDEKEFFLQELVQLKKYHLWWEGILTSLGAHKKIIMIDTVIDDHSYLML